MMAADMTTAGLRREPTSKFSEGNTVTLLLFFCIKSSSTTKKTVETKQISSLSKEIFQHMAFLKREMNLRKKSTSNLNRHTMTLWIL